MNILKKYYTVIVTICAFLFSSSSCLYDHDEFFGDKFSFENCDENEIFIFHFYNDESSSNLTSAEVLQADWNLISIPANCKFSNLALGYIDSLDPQKSTDWIHQIIVFRKETLEKYSKEELSEKNIYDALYVLTTQEILDMDRVVKFPLEAQGE